MELAVAVLALIGLTFLCAATNAAYLAHYAVQATRPPRRVGGAALASLSAALASESLLFGAFVAVRRESALDGPLSTAALLAVRTFLLVATAFISLLIWRQRGRGSSAE